MSAEAATGLSPDSAALAARLAEVMAEQQRQAALLAELAAQVTALRGQLLLLEGIVDHANRDAYGARKIVIQAEHQMQQGLIDLAERVNTVAGDLHQLRQIRESPEHQVYTLHSALAVIEQRLARIEGRQGAA